MAGKKAKQSETQTPDQSKLPAEQKGGEPTRSRPVFRPRVDIAETDEGLLVVADVPGASPQTLEITLEQRELTLRAEVQDDEPEGMSSVYREYEVGDYERRFQLAGDFDTEGIQATLNNGVLTVKIPRAKEAQAKRIEVKPG